LVKVVGRLPIHLDRFEPTAAILDRAQIRLYRTIVRPNARLGIDAPVMVIAGRLSARIRGRRRKLASPDERRTKMRVAAIKPRGMIERRSLFHGGTWLG
jgi:hypothetical protein